MKTRPSSLKGVGRYAYTMLGESAALYEAKKAYHDGKPQLLIEWLATRGWEREPVSKKNNIKKRMDGIGRPGHVAQGGIRRRIM